MTIEQLHERYQTVCKLIEQAREERTTTAQDVQDHEQALQFIKDLVQSVQEQTHSKVSAIVTRCLGAVYDDPYQFRIELEQRRGKTEAFLVFERDGVVVDPSTASGGGVVDVASFALRLACILLHRPQVRRIMIMDEPFKFVDRQALPRVRKLLETLADELNFQFVLVTHIPELVCGEVVEL